MKRPADHSTIVGLLATLAVLASNAPATTRAATAFSAVLDGLQNVPPIPAVTATGTATFTLSDDQKQLSFVINISGLSSPEIASHIHNAGPRDNGPAIFALPPGNVKTGTWAIPPDMVTELLAGRLYVNIHTETYITGEIRGNIVQTEVPVQDSTWGKIKSRYKE